VNEIAPAENDFQRYFGTVSSSVHSMISTLKKKGFITSIAGKSRTIKLLIAVNQLPELR
jgi:SOS-response transcriptional repressor LexA